MGFNSMLPEPHRPVAIFEVDRWNWVEYEEKLDIHDICHYSMISEL